jgi:hypothetical protein
VKFTLALFLFGSLDWRLPVARRRATISPDFYGKSPIFRVHVSER